MQTDTGSSVSLISETTFQRSGGQTTQADPQSAPLRQYYTRILVNFGYCGRMRSCCQVWRTEGRVDLNCGERFKAQSAGTGLAPDNLLELVGCEQPQRQ